MGTQIPKPDVFVEQIFEEEAATLPIPGLPECIVGLNRQIEYQLNAGAYDGLATSYSYPQLVSGATIDLNSVLVFLETIYGTFAVASGDFTADADSVDVQANVLIERTVVSVAITGISTIINSYRAIATGGVTAAGTRQFSEATATFLTSGVLAGQRLTIMGAGSDAGIYTIESVDSETQLTLKATPWTGFTSFTGDTALDYRAGADYSIFADNSADFLDDGVVAGMYIRIANGADLGDYRIDKVISDKQLQIDVSVIESQITGQTAATSDVFTDAAIVFANVSAGDVVVIEAGADAGQYEILQVIDDNNLQLEANMIATATGVNYRIDRKLATSVTQNYSVVDKSNEMTGDILVSYKALRSDNIQSLVTINNGNEILAKLGLVHPENEVAYAAFLASQITDKPFYVTAVEADTSEAHSVAAEFLESREVYALAILSQNVEVHQLWAAHVVAQSDYFSKHERICFINGSLFIKDIVATGITGATDVSGLTFTDTAATFISDGVTAGNYVVLDDESGRILSVDSETSLTLVSPGLTPSQTGLSWSVETKPLDKTEQAQHIAAVSSGYGQRRVINIWPSTYQSDYTDWDGTVIESANLNGYFFCAMAAAQVQEYYPQTPHTNQPLIDVQDLLYSNRYFSPTQLDIIAGGGSYIISQDEVGTPPYCRMQLTTDISTIEKRELSITKVIDHTAKFMRNTLRNFIGKNNITAQFLKQITMVADSILTRQIDDRVLIGGEVLRVVQDEDQPDTVIIDVSVDVPYPANYIKVRIIV